MESHFGPIHCETSAHNKINKMAVYATVTCGMIRGHPGMLRSEGVYCADTNFCTGREKKRAGAYCLAKEKNALLGNRCAKLSKVSDSLFPIQGCNGRGLGEATQCRAWFWGQFDGLALSRETHAAQDNEPPAGWQRALLTDHSKPEHPGLLGNIRQTLQLQGILSPPPGTRTF